MTPEERTFLNVTLTNPNVCLESKLMSEDEFVKGGVRLVEQIGAENYIRCILKHLKGEIVTNKDLV